MKKSILSIIALVLFAQLSYAQVEKGRVFIGGEYNFSSVATEIGGGFSTYSSNIALVPNIGFMIANTFAVGVGVGYRISALEVPITNGKSKVTDAVFVVAPFVRYYVPTQVEGFYFFLQARGEFGFGTTQTKTEVSGLAVTSTDSNLSTSSVFLSPNFAWFPTRHWSIEFGIRGLGYTLRDPKSGSNNTSTFEFNLDSLAPKLGLQFYF